MELVLNETPVRTSRNFNINNICIKDVKIPEKINEFKNVNILCQDTKVRIDENTHPIHLTYGLGKEITDLAIEKCNKKINMVIDSKTSKEVILDFNFDKTNPALFEDIEITANESTKETVVIKYSSNNEKDLIHNGVIRVNAKENSNISVIVINLLNNKATNFLSIQNNITSSARVNYTIVDFGGKNSITNLYSELLGEDAKNNINSIYLGNDSQVFDINYIAELKGQRSNVKIDVQGALSDTAKKHFKGTIDFKRGAKKAVGDENESCMLLSDTAKSISLPMLLCSEEDVEGNHSSSAGKIDDKELFYIMTRGFSEKEALKLMVKARFNKILETISNPKLRRDILDEIDTRLD